MKLFLGPVALFFGFLLFLNATGAPPAPSRWPGASITLQADCSRHVVVVIGDHLGHHTDSWDEVLIRWQLDTGEPAVYQKGRWYDGHGVPYPDVAREPIAILQVGSANFPMLVTVSLPANPTQHAELVYNCPP